MEDSVQDVGGSYGATVLVQEQTAPLTASAIPVKPPSEWFQKPNLLKVSPLTITSSGQVFGHIAAWHTNHIGVAGSVKPPKSRSDYAFFRTGVVETESGDMVDVGQITLSGGHASLHADARGAVAHYDSTESAVMDVAAGEDRHGIWVAGALRPGVTPEQIRTIRASSVSGDWRPINGNLELVAVCAVNCPGFPIPRARTADGSPIALVAAGIEPIVEQAMYARAEIDIEAGISAGLSLFRERMRNVEALLASVQMEDLRERVHSLNTPVDESEALTAAVELRSRVHSKNIESLRSRVRPDSGGDPLTASSEVAALRSWVHGDAASPFE